ncbi:MAG: carboxypeptidase regulatory-like domain-containing protein [Candidatus Methanomethylophilus sp.]|nr:carboxypeptidase regulatory-like domain-containing protein [Methanomethylophilus sp.]MBQ5397595.1 carboxypeptidase regulatory-like domain-containing protein [Methanomethylophilus sp.]MBQ5447952.1 carboxypeptidase regulatory-like domain-containing protein [Methanomethylophilus sp.]
MRNGIAVALALAVFFSAMAVPFAMNDSSDAAVETVTIKGVIIEIGETTQEAVEKVSITLTSATETKTAETDSEGKFSIDLKVDDDEKAGTNKITCVFQKANYEIRNINLPSSMTFVTAENIQLDLSKTDIAGTTYTIVDSDDLTKGIVMAYTLTTATITVTNGTNAIFNAKITLTDSNKTVYTGTTDHDGISKIPNVPVGPYHAHVVCDGYETYDADVSISKSTTTSFTLIQKEMPTYLGMTLYHILMLFGIVIGLILVSVAYVLCTRTWKGVDSSD